MYLEFVQFLTHRALQVRRSWFQPILGNERQGTRFSPYPRLAKDFPVRKIQGPRNLTVEARTNFGEQRTDLVSLRDTEVSQCLLWFVVRRVHRVSTRCQDGARHAAPLQR